MPRILWKEKSRRSSSQKNAYEQIRVFQQWKRQRVLEWVSSPQYLYSTPGHTPPRKLSGSLTGKCGHKMSSGHQNGSASCVSLPGLADNTLSYFALILYVLVEWGELWTAMGGRGGGYLPLLGLPAGLYLLEFHAGRCEYEIEFWVMECRQKSRAGIPGLVYQICPDS